MARRRRRKVQTQLQLGIGSLVLIFLYAVANPSSAFSIILVVFLLAISIYFLFSVGRMGLNDAMKAQKKSKQIREAGIAYATQKVDYLTPTEFEHYVASILDKLGYGTHVTPASNDGGIDVILTRDGITTGVQVKKWNGSVGRPELQNLVGAGGKFNRLMCVTSSYFTTEAREYAIEKNIVLVNGTILEGLAERAFGKDHIFKALSMKIIGSYK